MLQRIARACALTLTVTALSVAACSSDPYEGYGDSTGPNGNYQPPDPTARNMLQLTYFSSGLSASEAKVLPFAMIIFVNDDTVEHQPASNPYPTNTLCPELNLPVLAPGQRQSAVAESEGIVCGIHDNLDPENSMYKATIEVVTSN